MLNVLGADRAESVCARAESEVPIMWKRMCGERSADRSAEHVGKVPNMRTVVRNAPGRSRVIWRCHGIYDNSVPAEKPEVMCGGRKCSTFTNAPSNWTSVRTGNSTLLLCHIGHLPPLSPMSRIIVNSQVIVNRQFVVNPKTGSHLEEHVG